MKQESMQNSQRVGNALSVGEQDINESPKRENRDAKADTSNTMSMRTRYKDKPVTINHADVLNSNSRSKNQQDLARMRTY